MFACSACARSHSGRLNQALGFLLRPAVWNQHAEPGPLEHGNDAAKKVLRALVQAEAWEALAQRQKEFAKAYREDAERAAPRRSPCAS